MGQQQPTRGVMVNPFELDEAAAASYAQARPYYHPLALDLAFQSVHIDSVRIGLDVGCGTGLSTKALAERVERVIGMDPATAMLGARERIGKALFVRARAESIPVRSQTVDLVSCAAAMHWLTDAAFAELARVTRDGGYAVVYSDFFLGDLVDEPQFALWLREVYLPRLPTPHRRSPYSEPAMERVGFNLVAQDHRTHAVPMTPSHLASYLMTQSNATRATADGSISAWELRAWLTSELAHVVNSATVHARFAYRVWVAEKSQS